MSSNLTPADVSVTPGSGANIAVYTDAGNNVYQRVISAPEDSQLATYSIVYKGQSVGTSATTNIFTIAGSATKTVKITRLYIAATAATAASYFDVIVNRQSSADTGGTQAGNPGAIKYDISDSAATAAAPIFYNLGPTVGTLVGPLVTAKLFAPITGTPAPVTGLEIIPQNSRPAKAITLRGTTDVLAVTLNGVTPANVTSFDIVCEWTEN